AGCLCAGMRLKLVNHVVEDGQLLADKVRGREQRSMCETVLAHTYEHLKATPFGVFHNWILLCGEARKGRVTPLRRAKGRRDSEEGFVQRASLYPIHPF